MKYRNWQIPYTAPQPPEALLRAGYSPLLAVLLALRGYADPMQARAFLSGGDQSAFDPMLLQDMDKAVARIRTAIERRENVAVFGDYDVDGTIQERTSSVVEFYSRISFHVWYERVHDL